MGNAAIGNRYNTAMYIYAGIDEAGYGPLLGPLLVARTVFAIPKLDCNPADPPPDLWRRLAKAVCRNLTGRRGRIVVNDSKKLKTPAAGIRHLELGCLAFATLAEHQPDRLDLWLTALGESSHLKLTDLPWYAPTNDRPWESLPATLTPGEIAIARSMLISTCNHIGVELADLGAAVVFEDRFNRMVAATRSKAAMSFTFVAAHLLHIWRHYGRYHPQVYVDRQSGRTHYRELIAMNFPDAAITVLDESPELSSYLLETDAGQAKRAMTIRFLVDAEQAHLPVALASMISKYTRELLMTRLNNYFRERIPHIKPTAGYATDGKRFIQELEPHLPAIGLEKQQLCRIL